LIYKTKTERLTMEKYEGHDYWKNYMDHWFGSELIEKWSNHVVVRQIKSEDDVINIEVYDTGNSAAPTLIFSHGIAGYARILLPFTMPLFENGFNIIAPDLKGYGYNSGLKGDFEWNSHVQNLVDVVKYAKEHFRGKIILGGASMGGPLAYAAACLEEVDGLVAWCLWDLSDREFMLKETNTRQLTYILIPVFRLISKLFGKLRFKTYSLISYDTLTDSQSFNEMLKNDPQAGIHITLKGAASLVTQSKPITSHENFRKPVLVMQPGEDQMTPKYYIKKTFEKLGSSNKKYIEVAGSPHFPVVEKYYKQWCRSVTEFVAGC